MKRLFLLFLLLAFTSFNLANATPHFPNGMPMLGPLKGGITFWGQTDDGKYFDGVGYGYTREITIPKPKNIFTLNIGVSEYYYSDRPNEKTSSFNIQLSKEIENFTGNINLYIANSKEEMIKTQYQAQSKNANNFSYGTFIKLATDKKGANITLELVMQDGKNIYVHLDKQICQDLIDISQILYPTN